MPHFLHKAIQFFQVLLIPISLVGGSVRFITNERFLEFKYARPGFSPDQYGFCSSQCLSLADKNLEFVRDGLPLTDLSQQRLEGHPVYNSRELFHMQDVQDVWLIWQLSFAMIVVIGAMQWFVTKNRFVFASSLQAEGLLTVGLVTGIGMLAAIGWQFWFVFHRFFFNPGTWLFNYSDTLFRLLPTQFWFDIILTIFAMSLIGGGLLAFLAWRWKLTTRKT